MCLGLVRSLLPSDRNCCVRRRERPRPISTTPIPLGEKGPPRRSGSREPAAHDEHGQGDDGQNYEDLDQHDVLSLESVAMSEVTPARPMMPPFRVPGRAGCCAPAGWFSQDSASDAAAPRPPSKRTAPLLPASQPTAAAPVQDTAAVCLPLHPNHPPVVRNVPTKRLEPEDRAEGLGACIRCYHQNGKPAKPRYDRARPNGVWKRPPGAASSISLGGWPIVSDSVPCKRPKARGVFCWPRPIG
jgi:hypothetical protein